MRLNISQYLVSDAAGNTVAITRTVIISTPIIYFESETCKCPNAIVGDTAEISGVTCTAVDNSTIAGEIANGNINICKTLVTSMQ